MGMWPHELVDMWLRERLAVEPSSQVAIMPSTKKSSSNIKTPSEKKPEMPKKRKLKKSILKDQAAMARLKEMYESGAMQIEIADELGYNRKTIQGVIRCLVDRGILKPLIL